MKKAELERKEFLLAEALGGNTHLSILLAAYAGGKDHRQEIVDNIVAKYRKVLRANGPNFDGPLSADLSIALEAAEKHGPPKATKTTSTQLFSADEVQRCLFCQQEYRPVLQSGKCPHE